MPASSETAKTTAPKRSWTFYAWVVVVLGVAVAAVILGWHSHGGTTDPSVKANAIHMSRTTARHASQCGHGGFQG